MSQPLEPSPRAQAILRAIENEAQARRQRVEGQHSPGTYTPPIAPIPPMPLPDGRAQAVLQPPARGPSPEPLGEAADRLMRLVDHVVAQTEGVRARVKEVESSLDLLARELSQPEVIKPAAEAEVPALSEPRTQVSNPPAIEQPRPAPPEESDGARLMAIEIAVSGGSRGEVGDRLAQDFGVADPTPILDDVFGAGSDDSSRMPWTN